MHKSPGRCIKYRVREFSKLHRILLIIFLISGFIFSTSYGMAEEEEKIPIGPLITSDTTASIKGSVDILIEKIQTLVRETADGEIIFGGWGFEKVSFLKVDLETGEEYRYEATAYPALLNSRAYVLIGDAANIERFIMTPILPEGTGIPPLPDPTPYPRTPLSLQDENRVIQLLEDSDDVLHARGCQYIRVKFGAGDSTRISFIPDRSSYLFHIGFDGKLLLYAVVDKDGFVVEETSIEVEKGDTLRFDEDGIPVSLYRGKKPTRIK